MKTYSYRKSNTTKDNYTVMEEETIGGKVKKRLVFRTPRIDIVEAIVPYLNSLAKNRSMS